MFSFVAVEARLPQSCRYWTYPILYFWVAASGWWKAFATRFLLAVFIRLRHHQSNARWTEYPICCYDELSLSFFFSPPFPFFFFEFLQRVEIPHNASGMPRLLLHDANVLSTIKKATRSIHVDDKACSCILHSPLSTPPRKQCFWALERYFHPLSAQVNTARISFFRLRASRTQ